MLLRLARQAGVNAPDLRPVPGGGLQLEWRFSARELEIGILPDATAEFLAVFEQNRMVEGDLADAAEVPLVYLWVFGE